MKRLLPLALFAVSQAACAGGGVRLDTVTQSSMNDGDATTIIEGCGFPAIVGFTYCRIQEGQAADKALYFHGPASKCDHDACVYIKVYDNVGNLAWGGAIRKGETLVELKWSALVGPKFEVGHKGIWIVNTQVFYMGPDGKERDAWSTGDIFLRVFRQGYTPLQDVLSDPSFVWNWGSTILNFHMTSGLRAYVGPH